MNACDFEKALSYCKENAISLLRIFGADGERIDHFLINIILMARSAGEIDIEMFTAREYLHFLLPGEYHIPGVKGQSFSLLALKRTKGLTLRGAVYPLDNNTLGTGSRGLSNAFTGAELLIRFERGLLLFMTELEI
ncbi:MAG: thiamine diphosphokinase [Candidatus Marinimicrobia bacterium]|nr:thiamine diphosphokinase [Candidatus Neomarinimicrobiota bacterium]